MVIKSNIENNRMFQIDLFRFVAAMFVLLYHYTFRGYAADGLSKVNYPLLGEVFKYGYLGVNLFFMISGFVITLSLKDRSAFDFIKLRFIRLYPAYWFCVSITFICIYLWGGTTFHVTSFQYLVNMTMFNGFVNIPHIDGVYWTLMFELKFYILIGIFLLFRKRISIDVDMLIYSWLFLSLLYVPFHKAMFFRLLNSILIFEYSSYFIAGILFYKMYKYKKKKYLFFIIITFILSSYMSVSRLHQKAIYYNSSFSSEVVVGILFLSFFAMYLVSIKKIQFLNFFKMKKLGALTYSMYLIHQVNGYIFLNKMNNINRWLSLFMLIGFVISAAYFVNKKIELPAGRYLKEKIIKKNDKEVS